MEHLPGGLMNPSQGDEAEKSVPKAVIATISTTQRDPESGSFASRPDVLKRAAIAAAAIATISTTLLIVYLNDSPPASWFLVPGILLFLLIIGISVFSLANMAILIRSEDSKISELGESKISERVDHMFIATCIIFAIGLICLIFFTLIKTSHLTFRPFHLTQGTLDVNKADKTDVQGDINSAIKVLQLNFNNTVTESMKTLSVQVGEKFKLFIEEHDKNIQQYIDSKLKEIDSKLKGIPPTRSQGGTTVPLPSNLPEHVIYRIELLAREPVDEWARVASVLVDSGLAAIETLQLKEPGDNPCNAVIQALNFRTLKLACSEAVQKIINKLNPNLDSSARLGTIVKYPDLPVEAFTWNLTFDKCPTKSFLV